MVKERRARIALVCQGRHDRLMGSSRTRSPTPDLFATEPARSSSTPVSPASTIADGSAQTTSASYALPQDLPSALGRLNDDQLDRLSAAVIAEQKRRGKPPSSLSEPSRKARTREAAPLLAQGKLNAIRAAFKAGVTPSRIAREFGIAQSDVRKALARDSFK
jgi:hypothetical protein